ncbi:unnamed protein product [Polarella glacialis]|uniref:Calcineurin-like phosphoesterase domain-containing protein n=1 Tax=Polarella glacialis TaxID=89957 RepID=A0A813D7C7_POLGL|nr:unnamed protein product [Polarella glacialis]
MSMHRAWCMGACLLALLAVLYVNADELQALHADDECDAAQGSDCALNALRRKGHQTRQDPIAPTLNITSAYTPMTPPAYNASNGEGALTHTRGTGPLSNPPKKALDYAGMAWEDMSFPGTQEMHFLAVGDWGGMDGTVVTDGKRPGKEYYRVIQYMGGDTEGPHVMARSRMMCNFDPLVNCFALEGGPGCNPNCGFTAGLDDQAQILVAREMQKLAEKVKPVLVLNVGDNFYWGGIEVDCGTPMGEISPVAKHQFDAVYENIYRGPGLDGVPWLSVLGNHDWGGVYFNSGWDQQIAYTWASDRWIMPAPYWSQHVNFPDQGFSADIFMIDTNVFDAHGPGSLEPSHDICGNGGSSTQNCASQGGPPSKEECHDWFQDFWHTQKKWLKESLRKSTANWQIVNTHFPCGTEMPWYFQLHTEYGLDLLVTGHRHDQELWDNSGLMGGLTCVVTGGGGGITSEDSPQGINGASQYGFFDFAISKEKIKVELINQNGHVLKHSTVRPVKGALVKGWKD